MGNDPPPLPLSEFLAGYLAEVEDHLRASARNLLAVEADLKRGVASPGPVRELFRSLHTVKGLSAMVGVEPVVAIAHSMESVLRSADRGGGRLGERALELLLAGLRILEERVATVGRQEEVSPPPPDLLARLADLDQPADTAETGQGKLELPEEIDRRLTVSERRQLAASPRRAVRLDFIPSPERAAAGFTITSVREKLAPLAEVVKIVPLPRAVEAANPGGLAFVLLLLTDASDEAMAAATGGQSTAVITLRAPARPVATDPGERPEEELSGRSGVVRVSVARLDDALEKLSTLVVTRFRLERAVAELARQGVKVGALGQIVQESSRQLRDLRAAIMRARMVSADELLERIPLIVRGLGRATGKSVKLELEAGRAELDKSVAERIFPALVHLVRNAVDHALETAEERTAAGKPAEGRLRVTCHERSNNQLEVAIADDGRGIDAAKLAGRAGRPVPTNDEELLALMATAGLSTRDEATTTSGRGMGMDIVRRIVVDELGGELSLTTHAGLGTTFLLRIPLTITIVDAFSFRCGPQPFVTPVSLVEEIVEIDRARLTRAPGGSGRGVRMLERRGTAVPLVSLQEVFRLPASEAATTKGIVVRRAGQPYAFEVDQMLGQQEVVVRPLEDPLVRATGISGSTDLGDGQPTLVLDLVALSGRLSEARS